MKRIQEFFAIAILLAMICGALTACSTKDGEAEMFVSQYPQDCTWVQQEEPAIAADLDERLAAYVVTDITSDLSHLTSKQKQVLNKLVAAADVMHELFWEQACPCRSKLARIAAAVPAGRKDSIERYFDINMGPWDRRLHWEPFLGSWPHPPGANYYPLTMTEAEKELVAGGEGGLADLFSMVRRDESGKLIAIPYSVYFAEPLNRAAALLREAAAITENESLKLFLESRAQAFLTDDYYESDMLWMDLDSPVEVTIGPYETYEDGQFGFKAAFEAFVTVTDPTESARLDKFKKELPWLESQLPIADAYKNPNRGTESPIRVGDEVYSAGDTRAGIQTIAFNLPNDERVREAKGSKKVMLRNVMNAKFQKILVPIAGELLAAEQVAQLSQESFFLHTLLHEISHGLGPGRIQIDGRQTEVRLELKDTYSTMEEAKADVMGEWAIFKLQEKGYFPESMIPEQAATYLAGLFRSVRFGISEDHGQANAIQFNYFWEKGVVLFDEETGKFAIDVPGFVNAVTDLVREICVLQAEGDYQAAKAMIERYAVMPPVLAAALERLGDIPVDIKPRFSLAGVAP